jgi:hypothetical protein
MRIWDPGSGMDKIWIRDVYTGSTKQLMKEINYSNFYPYMEKL